MKSIIYVILLALAFQSCELVFNKQNVKEIIKSAKPQKTKSSYRDGLYVKKYNNGKMKTAINYTDGYKNGVAKEYYPDGNLKAVYHYNYNNKNGLVTKYYTSGRVKWVADFKNNQKNGFVKQYYLNGKLKSKQSFVRDIPLPDLEEYKKDGSLVTKYPKLIVDKNIKTEGGYKNSTLTIRLSYGNEKTKFYSEKIDTTIDLAYNLYIIPKNGGNIVTVEKNVRIGNNHIDNVTLTAMYKTKFDNLKLYYWDTEF